MEPKRCVFGVFFPHTGQHQPHDLVMTQGSRQPAAGAFRSPAPQPTALAAPKISAQMGARRGAHAKALGGDADEATTGDHVPCEGI